MSLLDKLPARPPTPPREVSKAVEEAISFLDDSNEVDRATNQSRSTLQAAQHSSPLSSQASIGTNLAVKTVDFSPHPLFHKIPVPGEPSSPATHLLKRSPSSKDAKPLKSILKPANDPSPPTPEDLSSKLNSFSPEVPGSFGKMLQSVLQQLAGPSRAARLDAYLVLNGVLKAHEGIPEPSAMTPKMAVLMQFLARDIAWKDTDGNLDVNIISQALKLTMSLLFNAKTAEALDDDFKTFLIDRSILVLEQPDMPKPIIKIHMHVLAQQKFGSHVMTERRADRILTALQTIEDRCSGNSVVASRIVIFSRLLHQAPAVMLTRTREWLEHVFHGMLSDIQEIRGRAIDMGTQAGLKLGQQAQAGKALQELFDTEIEDGQTYCDYFSLRLVDRMSDKEIGACVPQIWSAVVLFFRYKRRALEQWPTFKPWARIIQRCLNSGNITSKYQAHLAWNKVVFAVMPDSSTTSNMMRWLKVPICAGLDKRGSDKHSQQSRQYALDSYYNLLHYALRPGLSSEEHDAAWDLFVDPILSDLIRSSGKGRFTACRVLHGLVSGSTGVWNVNAANELTLIKPEELPKLEPRWIRSRLGKILKLMEPVVAGGMWSSPEANTTLDATWKSLMQSVSVAGSQEVKTSTDLKQAIAQLMSTFRRLWSGCTSPLAGVPEDRWLYRYVSLIETTVSSLGPGPFTEEILLTSQDDEIEVAPTPSHRSSKHHNPPRSPLGIIVDQFYQPPTALAVDETYKASASAILQHLTSFKPAPTPRLELLSRALTSASATNVAPSVEARLWSAFAANAVRALELDDLVPNGQEPQNLGQGIRHALDILNKGVLLASDTASCEMVVSLYDAIYGAAKAGASDGGVVLAVMEPFAKTLKTMESSISRSASMRLTIHLFERAAWPRSRQSLDQARMAVWGVGLPTQKTSIYDPFEHVYDLLIGLMVNTYNNLDNADAPELDLVAKMFSTALDFLDASPASLLATAFRKVQKGFAIWMEDSARKTAQGADMSQLLQQAWRRILLLLQSLPSKDSTFMKGFEEVLVAGLSSPHKSIVNETIIFWNESFSSEQSLEYPVRLAAVLRARSVDADITLPAFPGTDQETVPATLPTFFESQDVAIISNAVPNIRKHLEVRSPTPKASRHAGESWLTTAQRSPFRRDITSSPMSKIARKSASSTPKARLRHDDSQIQFAPIDSSPLPSADESQILTEHQKEVKDRQQQNAQLFPDLSSSPLAQSTALPRSIPKRLNFTSNNKQANLDEGPGTPTGLPDAHALIGDDLLSSPTPSSAKAGDHDRLDADEDEQPETTAQDPPSSPPRGDDDDEQMDNPIEAQSLINLDDTTIGITDFAAVAHDDIEDDVADYDGSDLPSDSQLPTLQLQQEAEAAEGAQECDSNPVEVADDYVQSSQILPLVEQGAIEVTQNANIEKEATEVGADEAELDVTRIEDSFVEQADANTEADSQSQPSDGSQQSRPATRKRKRPSSTVYSAKKRKPQSPLKRIASYLFGSQEEEEEDIGDEIIVAPRRRQSSPASEEVEESPASEKPMSQESEAVENEPVPVKDEANAMPPPAKRGRGRPRKSASPAPSGVEGVNTRSLKRRASTLSVASTSEEQDVIGTVNVSTPPAKARKQRQDEDVKSTSASQTSPRAMRLTRRSACAVVIDSTEPSHETEHADEVPSSPATPSQQLADGEAASAHERPIATPRSILARLRAALTDFGGMILGAQEEREYDDVLFELRREVHEAGRRGRG